MMRWAQRRSTPFIGFALVCAVLALAPPVSFGKGPPPADIEAQALPAEARATLARIRAGGPFPYERDGVVFGNREHLLPAKARGYYHEYTVPTPGVKSRGARRVVCGNSATPVECYYSDDHYQSFRKIRP